MLGQWKESTGISKCYGEATSTPQALEHISRHEFRESIPRACQGWTQCSVLSPEGKAAETKVKAIIGHVI